MILRDKPEIIEKFLSHIREGLSVPAAAARTAGIVGTTVYEYLRQGREDRENELDNAGPESAEKSLHSQFLDSFEEAEAEGLAYAEKLIQDSIREGIEIRRVETTTMQQGDGEPAIVQTKEIVETRSDPISARWLLERRRPEVYGRKDKVDVELPAGKVILLEGESIESGAPATLRSREPAPPAVDEPDDAE